MLYRIFQFISALFPFITAKDKSFTLQYLNNVELKIFNSLQKSDQKHALRIAYHLEKLYPQDKILIKAALLHDIGKTMRPLNVLEKSLTVILDQYFHNFAKKLAGKNNSIMDIYYHHADKGAELALKLKLDKDIIFFIKNHHDSSLPDQRLQALVDADNSY